jgi:hypothetical protein
MEEGVCVWILKMYWRDDRFYILRSLMQALCICAHLSPEAERRMRYLASRILHILSWDPNSAC